MQAYRSKVYYKSLIINQLIYLIDNSSDEIIELKDLYSGIIFEFWDSEEKFLQEIIPELQDRGYTVNETSVIKKRR